MPQNSFEDKNGKMYLKMKQFRSSPNALPPPPSCTLNSMGSTVQVPTVPYCSIISEPCVCFGLLYFNSECCLFDLRDSNEDRGYVEKRILFTCSVLVLPIFMMQILWERKTMTKWHSFCRSPVT